MPYCQCLQLVDPIFAHRSDCLNRHVEGALDGLFIFLFDQNNVDHAGDHVFKRILIIGNQSSTIRRLQIKLAS
jgi:hypothetical protein